MNKSIDKRNTFNEQPFEYTVTKDNKMLVYWRNQHIKTVVGKDCLQLKKKLAAATSFAEEQLLLAKVTGNFKRGNERRGH